MVVVVSLKELLQLFDNSILTQLLPKWLYTNTHISYTNTKKTASFTQIFIHIRKLEDFMLFEKCLHCTAIQEKKCAGPNFMAMSTKELFDWGTKYQKIHGITNAQLAEWSGIPKGTIDGIKYRDDVRHETIYPILKALIEGVGGQWGGEPCAIQPESNEHLKEHNEQLKKENEFLKETIAHERKHLKHKNRAILILTITLGILVCGLLVALFIL